MEHNIIFRKKDKGLQVIVEFKDSIGKWRQKSKQGFEDSREGKQKAKEYANKIIQEIENVNYNKIFKDKSDITIGDLKQEYLQHIKVHREYNTYKNYLQTMKYFPLDHIRLLDLQLAHIQRCIDTLVDKVSITTIERRKTIFKCMLNYANRQYNIPIPNITNLVLPSCKKSSKEKRALNIQEQIDCLKFYKDKSLDYYITILLSLKCGLRIGEICGLTWEDIDFDNSILKVNKQWKISKRSNIYDFGELKSKNSYRVVPIPPTTLLELKRIKNINRETCYDRLMLTKSTQQVSVNLDKHLQRNFKVCIHELRHTYATNLISNGIDFKTSAKLLGHDVEQTMRTYSHVTDDMLKKATILINNIF